MGNKCERSDKSSKKEGKKENKITRYAVPVLGNSGIELQKEARNRRTRGRVTWNGKNRSVVRKESVIIKKMYKVGWGF